MNLYTLSKNMQEFVASIPEELTEEEAQKMQDRFVQLNGSFEEKVEDCVKFLKEQEAMANAIATEINRLCDLQKGYNKKVSQMEKYIDMAMQTAGSQSLQLPIAKISYRKSTVCVVDEAVVSDDWKKTKEVISIDKAGIKKALQEGVEVKGAYLQENQNLQIK